MKALITGASRGIGFAIAEQLVRQEFECLLTSKDAGRLKAATTKLEGQKGARILAQAADLSDLDSIDRLVHFSLESKFAPDALILDAGVFFEGNLEEAPIDELSQTLQVNLVSAVKIVKSFLPALRDSAFPRIVLIGSTASLEAYAFGPYYGISKWAVRGLAANLRNEFKSAGVGVTLVTPGGTWTDLWAGEDLPRNRLLEPSDIAKMVGTLFTLSTQAVVEEVVIRPMLGDMH